MTRGALFVRESIRFRPLDYSVRITVFATLSLLAANAIEAQTPTPTPTASLTALNPHITTNHGCLEMRQNATFVVGQSITVSFRVDSNTLSQAQATILDIVADGTVQAFVLGTIPTNQTRAFAASVAPPTGIEQLQFRVRAPGMITSIATCSFFVVGQPGTSPTPTPAAATSTTPSPTATASPTSTAPPAAHLEPQITTNRGCLENKDDATFVVGESIVVSFEIGSDTVPAVRATIFDILPNGLVGVIGLGTVTTNHTRSFIARVTPPTGTEQLQLRAHAGTETAISSCSFLVVRVPAVTPTPTPTAAAGVLRPQLGTDRGCVETKQNPVYAVGEQITLNFQVDSDTVPLVVAGLVDILPNGLVGLIPLGTMPTNQPRSFTAIVGPPAGLEHLLLRARAIGVPMATTSCSFFVSSAGQPPTPTATQKSSPTASPTPTVTPTAVG